jgi:hypothetical protein
MDESARNEPGTTDRLKDLAVLEFAILRWQETAKTGTLGDDLHRYFSAWGGRSWVEVAAEGRRIYNLMFDDEKMDEYSPLDDLFHAVAAQAAAGAIAVVAEEFGIDAEELEDTVGVPIDS